MKPSAKYRHALPQLDGRLFLSDSGLETTLVFLDGVELPCFASFPLVDDADGAARLAEYFRRHVAIARAHGVGIVLESPTWRANPNWGRQLGYGPEALARVNRRAIEQLVALREACETPSTPIVVSGNIGPAGDGYVADARMGIDEAREYHAPQVAAFADTAADMVAAFTLNYAEEAIGIALAAKAAGMPLALSFTVETDGMLPSGQALQDAIDLVEAQSGGYPAYYMINCAHPDHFAHTLRGLTTDTRLRIRGLRANASRRSHAELDASTDLDAGNPLELARDYARVREQLPALNVVGGCCGTDHRHVEAIAAALAPGRKAA